MSSNNITKKTKQCRNAFTLAEVLITLGVIGVVAAVTLPTLVQSYKKHEVETRLAKFYTTINQAINMSTVQNGEPADWVKDCGRSNNPLCTTEDIEEWFKTYIGKYMQYAKIEKDDANRILVYFNDGGIMEIPNYIYDINFYISEKSLTNVLFGRNAFRFRFSPVLRSWATEDFIQNSKYSIKNTIEPYTYHWDGNPTSLYDDNGVGYACKTGDGSYCTKLIQLNGWKIPKDYPLKF